jgi:hypothetical protein
MSRRLLELCLLAYPRCRRERDRDFLRDLALDLGGTDGFARQAVSLLVGGLKERIEGYRRRRVAPVRTWARRGAVACLALIALTVAASGLTGIGGGGAGSVHEVEEYACVYAEDPPSRRDELRLTDAGGCAETRRLVAARRREGWDCTSRRRSGAGRQSTTWECARGAAAVAWLPL